MEACQHYNLHLTTTQAFNNFNLPPNHKAYTITDEFGQTPFERMLTLMKSIEGGVDRSVCFGTLDLRHLQENLESMATPLI
jgi:hypothetical protein